MPLDGMHMTKNGRAVSRWVLLTGILALPCVLLFSSLQTLHELDEQKQVYLRERVGEIAARLETLAVQSDALSPLFDSEPYLRDIQIIEKNTGASQTSELQPIWNGRQLYRTQTLDVDGQSIYRAYIPFHTPRGLRIARIDLDKRAADFLLIHARHNVIISILGGIVLVTLALYTVWTARRSAVLERRHIELEHLAQLGHIAAGLAHEIRNPLGTIKGFAQLAIEHADKPTVEMLSPVISETLRLERLVNDLLLYGRPPAPSRQEVFWPDVACELEQHARSFAGDHTIGFTFAKEPVRFITDPDLLRQILLNGLRNAVDAVAKESSPRVSVGTVAKKGVLEIVIADNGPGISTEIVPKVFEPFFSTRAFGTGLGLPICLQSAKLIAGSVELHNRKPHGLEFVLRLPEAEAALSQRVDTAYGKDPGSR